MRHLDPLSICLIASARFPVAPPFMGGLEAHTHALASGLVRRGHRVSVFAAPGSDPQLGVTELAVQAPPEGDGTRADVGSSSRRDRQEDLAYGGLMTALADGDLGEFDVVHNVSLHHLPVERAGLLRTPVVTTLHTPPEEGRVRDAVHDDVAGVYVAVSAAVARAWSSSVRAEVVHNGVDTDAWRAGPGGGPAVWTGRLVREKAPHEAVDAARRAGPAIDLAGPLHDPTYFATEIEPRLGPEVCYVGHLEGVEHVELVRRASVAVVSSRWQEPFGLVAAEAMSCGTPVAAYDVGGLAEVVDDESGRLATPGDTGDLAAAMTRATTLDRRRVRRSAVDRFALARMIAAYERVYRAALGARS